jgi:hypothetical protein
MVTDSNLGASKELTVDIVVGGVGKAAESISSVAQQALLESFRAAAKREDLAARLVIPIQLLTVTGAKVITAHGYDAYKITIAIHSDDPNAVAREIFATGVGLAATGIAGVVLKPAMAFGP